MVTATQLVAKLSVDGYDDAKSKLSDMGKSADQTQFSFGQMLKQGLANAAGFAIFDVGAKALGFVKNQMADTLSVAMKHADIMAQTATVIKSTGDASGMTTQQLGNLALSLSKVTTFSDDQIQSGENLLLTFKGIGKDVFPSATQAMLDMAQAMGGDTKGAALQLGKALNDPTTGLSALSRVGVTFTAQQKEMIKHMVAVGDTAGAQKIMLKELQSEFGGSAEAAGKTFGGQLQILKNNLMDVKQQIGGALLPILGQLTGWVSSQVMPVLSGFSDWFAKTGVPGLQSFGSTVGKIFGDVGRYLSLFDLTSITYAWKQFTGAVHDLLSPLSADGDVMGTLAPRLTDLRNLFSQLLVSGIRDVAGFITNVANAVKGFSENINVENISSLSGSFNQLVSPVKMLATALGGELSRELKTVGGDLQQFGSWFGSSVMPAIKEALPGFLNLANTLIGTVGPAFVMIRGVVFDVIQHAFEKFGPIIAKVVPPLIKFAGVLANDIANGLKFIMPYVIQAAKAIGDFASGLIDRVAPIVSNVFAGISVAVGLFMKAWNQSWPMMSAVLKGIWDEIVGLVKIGWSLITGIINIGLDLISGNWGQMWTDIKNMLKGVWDGIVDVLKGAWEMVVGVFTGLYDDLVGHSIIPDMINGIVSWFEQLPGRAMAFITNLVTNMTTTLGGLGAKALTWAGDMINQFIQGIENGITGVGDAVSKVASKIANFLHFSKPDIGPLVDVDNWMPDFGDLLAKGLTDQIAKIQSPALKLASTMSMNINPVANTGIAGGAIVPSSLTQSQQVVVKNYHYHYLDGKQITSNVMTTATKTARTSGPIRQNLSQ